MVANIYRCENCWLRWACYMPKPNGYCQDFVLDKTRFSEEDHIYYKVKLRCELARNRLIEEFEKYMVLKWHK